MRKTILKVVLSLISGLCFLIELCSKVAALAGGWIIRILGLVTLIIAGYCKIMNWTTDQNYVTALFVSGILCLSFPAILGILSGLAEGIREMIRTMAK